MNILLIIAFLFCIGSIIGWGMEVLFRHFVMLHNGYHSWINPGFLTGPYLPLYGFGLSILYLLASLERFSTPENSLLNKLCLFLIMAIGMTVIEYIAGIIFIKGMKVKLWDYSGMKGNIQGIICPLYSAIWAALGAIYYFLIHPYILNALSWLSRNLAFSFFIGMFYGIFVIDVVHSFQIVVKIKRFASENNIIVFYEELKENIRRTKLRQKHKANFLFAMYSDTPLAEHLKQYMEHENGLTKRIKDTIKSYKKTDK